MKNALILHGTDSNSHEHWFPWLKEKLEHKGYKVWVPNLPHSNIPNIQTYNTFINSKNWKYDENTVLIGHSSGAVAILGILQNLPQGVIIDTVILVSTFKDDLGWDTLKELFLEPFIFSEIKKHAKHFILIHSDNDPYCPLEHAKYLSEKLGGKLIVLAGKGHFNKKNGEDYTEFPELLQILTENHLI